MLVTPYSQAVTDHEAEFLNDAGYEVIYAKGYELAGSDAYCATPPAVWRDRALAAARPDADVYFLSCANISVFGIIEELETRLGRPVITSNQTVIWDALARLGWSDRRGCPGRLFATPAIAEAAPAAQRSCRGADMIRHRGASEASLEGRRPGPCILRGPLRGHLG